MVSSKIIDKINIEQASILAMKRAVSGLKIIPTEIIVDGVDSFKANCPVTSLVRADNLIMEVMAASIIAKVYRDKLMQAILMQNILNFILDLIKGIQQKNI